MKPNALELIAPPVPAFGENLFGTTIPDIETDSAFPDPHSEFSSLPPSSFAPAVLLNGRDRSQHHYDMLDAEIKRLEDRILELKMIRIGAPQSKIENRNSKIPQ